MAAIPFQPMMESRPIREIAYEVLKHAIITGEIPAGERIVETEYADRLHISRTPLREALRKLERDGLVEYVQRRGVIVRAFTIADVEEIYTIRNALEMLTLPAIIQKATADDIATLRDRLHEMDGVMASRDFETLSPMARAFHRQMTEICGQNRNTSTSHASRPWRFRRRTACCRRTRSITSWWTISSSAIWSISRS